MNLEKVLEVAKEAAVKAGYAIMDVYENAEDMEITYKDGDMPLTAADKASNRIIVDALKEAFPEYAILSEEEKDDLSRLENDFCFVVDPLDGTKEFIKRNGQFTVNIALSYQHIAAQLNNEAAEDLVSKYADLCQEQDRLLHYIGFLNQRQQDVIRRYYFEQQPWGEIADGMGSTPRTVQRLRQQAVEELANLYAFADGILRR